MKRILLIFLLLINVTALVAQDDLYTKKSLAIPADGDNGVEFKKDKPPVLSIPKIEYKRPSFTGKKLPKDIGFLKTNEFVDPGKKKMKELQQSVEGGHNVDISQFKRHEDLGVIKYNGNQLVILCRDFGMQDGDKIQIYVNDEVVKGQFVITNSGVAVVIPLVKGFNKIQFLAVNMGTYAPNTAQFIIRGENNKEVLLDGAWNLATGFKAKVVVLKEE